MPLDQERWPGLHKPQPVESTGTGVTQLPEDEPPAEVSYELFAQFLAYVKTSKITPGGEVELTFGIPLEDKYKALPVTDLQGVSFYVGVYEPVVIAHSSEAV
jgi:hypothetical protein